jgi:PKD repeat protein
MVKKHLKFLCVLVSAFLIASQLTIFSAIGDPLLAQLQPPEPPVAKFSFSPRNAWINESVLFNASSSDGNITKYEWDFGDGNRTITTIPTINHTYSKEGYCSVSLNVTDNNGLWNVTNNTTVRDLVMRTVIVTFITDLDKNGMVDIFDISVVAKAYGSKPENPNWNDLADLNHDGIINILDIATVARDYGMTVPLPPHLWHALTLALIKSETVYS